MRGAACDAAQNHRVCHDGPPRAGPLTCDSTPDVRAVDRDTLGPILLLLENSDIEVQRAASAALGNLAVNSTLASFSPAAAF